MKANWVRSFDVNYNWSSLDPASYVLFLRNSSKVSTLHDIRDHFNTHDRMSKVGHQPKGSVGILDVISGYISERFSNNRITEYLKLSLGTLPVLAGELTGVVSPFETIVRAFSCTHKRIGLPAFMVISTASLITDKKKGESLWGMEWFPVLNNTTGECISSSRYANRTADDDDQYLHPLAYFFCEFLPPRSAVVLWELRFRPLACIWCSFITD